MRFFTADFHLGFEELVRAEGRPFATVAEHDAALVRSCAELAGPGDVIVHVGDLFCYRADMPRLPDVMKGVKAQFVNVRGNHDLRNKVRSLCDSMTISLGRRYPNVVVGHYPSYDRRAAYRRRGWIQLCGHVHGKWRHCLDLDRQILNVNVGVDANGYRIVPETEVAAYVDELLRHRPGDLYRCRSEGGKLVFAGDPKGPAV